MRTARSAGASGRSASALPGWFAALLPAALFAVLWVPLRATAPMLHTEASVLVHGQLGPATLWRESATTGRTELLYRLLASSVANRADALAVLRWASLVAGVLVVLAVARTAAGLWGAGAALVCGGFLVVQPLLVPLSLGAGAQLPALAGIALAGWQLTSRLEHYEELGAGTTVLHALLLVWAVGLDLTLAPALLAHIVYAATMRPSARGWRQLVGCWLLAAGTGAWVWWGTAASTSIRGAAVVWAAVRDSLAGPSPLFWLAPALALLVLVVSALGSGGRSLLDPGLGLALGLLIVTPVACVLAGPRWRGGAGSASMTAVVLGLGLLIGCAGGQWRGQGRQRFVVGVLVAALALAGWRGRVLVAPSWHNADGNPPLARDLVLAASAGEVVVVDDASAPGLSAALADRMGDHRLWQQAREALPDARLVVFAPVSLEPWSSRSADVDEARGRLVWVGAQSAAATPPLRCTARGTDHYAQMVVREFDCAG